MPGPCCALSLIQNVLMPKTNCALRLSYEIFHFCLDSQNVWCMQKCVKTVILFFPTSKHSWYMFKTQDLHTKRTEIPEKYPNFRCYISSTPSPRTFRSNFKLGEQFQDQLLLMGNLDFSIFNLEWEPFRKIGWLQSCGQIGAYWIIAQKTFVTCFTTTLHIHKMLPLV